MACMPNIGKEVRITTITSASLPAKKRILTVCVKLFLEQGYKKTTGLQMAYWACAPLGVNSTYPVSMVTSPESPL